VADIIQFRRDTAANWTSVDPTLANGEMGYETDTGKSKMGDGTTAWTLLSYYVDPTASADAFKVSSNDTTGGYLEDKLIVAHGTNTSDPLELSTLNDGADEDRQLQFDEAKVDHDQLLNFEADEHIDWAVTGGEDIHVDRITATAVTQHEGSIDHNQLANFEADEHIDWSVTGGEDVHIDRIPDLSATYSVLSHSHDIISEGDSSVEVVDTGTGQVDITVDTAVVLSAIASRVDIGPAGSTNELRLMNPGIGNSSTIEFEKTNDFARIVVTETVSDTTKFQFFMSDNPGSIGDVFEWFIQSYRGPGANWKPLVFENYDITMMADDFNLNGSFNLQTAKYYSSNGVKDLTSFVGTGSLNLSAVDISGNTGTDPIHYILEIDGTGSPNTFTLYLNNDGETPEFTGTSITGSSQALANGVEATFSGTTGGVIGDQFFFSVWPDGVFTVTGDQNITGEFNFDSGQAVSAIVTAISSGSLNTELPTALSVYNEVGAEISTHAGAADPHTGYQLESEKSAANG